MGYLLAGKPIFCELTVAKKGQSSGGANETPLVTVFVVGVVVREDGWVEGIVRELAGNRQGRKSCSDGAKDSIGSCVELQALVVDKDLKEQYQSERGNSGIWPSPLSDLRDQRRCVPRPHGS